MQEFDVNVVVSHSGHVFLSAGSAQTWTTSSVSFCYLCIILQRQWWVLFLNSTLFRFTILCAYVEIYQLKCSQDLKVWRANSFRLICSTQSFEFSDYWQRTLLMAKKQYDLLFKLLLIGDSGVGECFETVFIQFVAFRQNMHSVPIQRRCLQHHVSMGLHASVN